MSGLRRDVVILGCAVSAGIHGALAPAHFAEGAGAGLGFVASTILLAGLAVFLTVRPASSRHWRARRSPSPACSPPTHSR